MLCSSACTGTQHLKTTPLNLLHHSRVHTGMHSNLKTLDLCYNRIGDRGATALALMLVSEVVESTIPLHALELEGNMVGRGGL